MIFKILILLGLVKLLSVSKNAILCAVIYGSAGLFLNFIIKGDFKYALLVGVVNGALSFIYFWLLNKTENSSWWWVILIGGVVFGLV